MYHLAKTVTGRDGRNAAKFDGGYKYQEGSIELFYGAMPSGLDGANPRTICLWAQLDTIKD